MARRMKTSVDFTADFHAGQPCAGARTRSTQGNKSARERGRERKSARAQVERLFIPGSRIVFFSARGHPLIARTEYREYLLVRRRSRSPVEE